MRLRTRNKATLAHVTGPSRSELLGTLPTRPRPQAANRSRRWVWVASRLLGALAVLAVGAVHLHDYVGLYSHIPTIGTLFFLNFVGATAIGVGLLAPIERMAGRHASTLLILLALAGITLATVAFAFLLISQHTPLFGFKEPGYDRAGIDAVRAAEVATVIFLGAFLTGQLGLKPSTRRW